MRNVEHIPRYNVMLGFGAYVGPQQRGTGMPRFEQGPYQEMEAAPSRCRTSNQEALQAKAAAAVPGGFRIQEPAARPDRGSNGLLTIASMERATLQSQHHPSLYSRFQGWGIAPFSVPSALRPIPESAGSRYFQKGVWRLFNFLRVRGVGPPVKHPPGTPRLKVSPERKGVSRDYFFRAVTPQQRP